MYHQNGTFDICFTNCLTPIHLNLKVVFNNFLKLWCSQQKLPKQTIYQQTGHSCWGLIRSHQVKTQLRLPYFIEINVLLLLQSRWFKASFHTRPSWLQSVNCTNCFCNQILDCRLLSKLTGGSQLALYLILRVPRWTVSMRGKRRESDSPQRFCSEFPPYQMQPAAVFWPLSDPVINKLNVLFWRTFGGKLLPFITSSLTTISRARGGVVGGPWDGSCNLMSPKYIRIISNR